MTKKKVENCIRDKKIYRRQTCKKEKTEKEKG